MPTYWNAFLSKYGNLVYGRPLHKILEAFWYYCNDREKECAEIMNKEPAEKV